MSLYQSITNAYTCFIIIPCFTRSHYYKHIVSSWSWYDDHGDNVFKTINTFRQNFFRSDLVNFQIIVDSERFAIMVNKNDAILENCAMSLAIGHPLWHFLADSAPMITAALMCGSLYSHLLRSIPPQHLFAQCLPKGQDWVCFRCELDPLTWSKRRDEVILRHGCGRIQPVSKYDNEAVARWESLSREEIYCLRCLGKKLARAEAGNFLRRRMPETSSILLLDGWNVVELERREDSSCRVKLCQMCFA